jgi:hypothetical protein
MGRCQVLFPDNHCPRMMISSPELNLRKSAESVDDSQLSVGCRLEALR